MTAPRQVIPGETCSIFRRISERRFLLRPDKIVNNIVEFCIGLAAQKHCISLHVLAVMTNDYHLQRTDPEGRRSNFMRDANRMIAQCLNKSASQIVYSNDGSRRAVGARASQFGAFNLSVGIPKCLISLRNGVQKATFFRSRVQ
jgi:hypothetical protein